MTPRGTACGVDGGGTTEGDKDDGGREGAGGVAGVACGGGVEGAGGSTGGTGVGGAGVGGVDVGGDAGAGTLVVVAAVVAGEDAHMESSLAKISATMEDAVAGRADVGSAAGANLRLMAATNPAHEGTPMFLSTQQYH